MSRLYHVTLTMQHAYHWRGIGPEKRTFTRRGKGAADAKADELRDRWPRCKVKVRPVPRSERAPVFFES